MRKLLYTVYLLVLLAVPTHATGTDTQKLTETMDLLQKEVSCIVIADYSIRHLNLFIYQMETIDNSSGERKKVVAPLVFMAIMMRLDADKLVTELTSQGLDRVYIDKKIDEIINDVMTRYSQGYIDSTNYDKAEIFMRSLMTEQKACEDWFKQRFGTSAIDPSKDNRGVDG
jgi:hypothetical protein